MLLDDRSDVGLATVYRVLTQFEQAGILKPAAISKAARRCMNSTKASTTTIWSAWIAAKVEEFYDAEIESASKPSPNPRASGSPTMR